MRRLDDSFAPEPTSFSRRQFLHATAALGAVAALHSSSLMAGVTLPQAGMIDTNVYIGRWPFRRMQVEGPESLVAKLQEQGVTEAWTGSLDALLYKDISGVNTRLADDCRRFGRGMLVPIAALNPTLPGWEHEMQRCVEVHGMLGVRLHPNYHGYTLAEPLAERVLERAASFGLLVQIALIMEDERTIHPLVNVPAVDAGPLLELIKRIPTVRVQLLNAFRTLRGSSVIALAAHRVGFEIAMLDGVEGIANLLKLLPPDRLCFGSYTPVFYFESASLKLRESVLSGGQAESIRVGSARRLLTRV